MKWITAIFGDRGSIRAAANTLVMRRFNGEEIFSIDTATVTTFAIEKGASLLVEFTTKRPPIKTLPDTADWEADPKGEIILRVGTQDWPSLVGSKHTMRKSWDKVSREHLTWFCYSSHQDLERNVVRFLRYEDQKFLIHWTGTVTDVNHYDGSKPDTQIEIHAWFTLVKGDSANTEFTH